MIDINSLLPQLKTESYETKAQLIAVLFAEIRNKRIKITASTKEKLYALIISEIKEVETNAPLTEGYKEKSKIYRYADMIFGMVMTIYKNPLEMPPELMTSLKNVSSMIEKEMYLERTIDNMFEQEIISKADVDSLIETLSKTKDEYEKGLFYMGIAQYSDKLDRFIESSKASISEYISSELERYLREYDAENVDLVNSLEIACDASRHFANERITESLYKALSLGNNAISYYTVSTLLCLGKDISEDTVIILAKDRVYAELTYKLLCKYGKQTLFPAEYSDEIYLAESDLIHWLIYPTELGKVPDEIEFLGKIERKDEIYHVFKFRSDSDNLDDERKNEWLLGWSGSEGGTFSQFEKFEKFEKKTIEKTLKYIKKKVL